jgi:hypothetical protein
MMTLGEKLWSIHPDYHDEGCLTRRAADVGYAPRFVSLFLNDGGFRF